jgi:hypothetical protein
MSVKQCSAGLIASLFISAAGCVAPAYGAEPIGLSGYELSTGTRHGDVVRNIIFAGTTNTPCNCFTSQSDGGTWVATADRTGGQGIGAAPGVITGGRLAIDTDVLVSYRITGGTVTWPATLEQDIGCGPGVATVYLTLSRARTVTGCLDDTHLDPFRQPFVFPPRIWGTLQ